VIDVSNNIELVDIDPKQWSKTKPTDSQNVVYVDSVVLDGSSDSKSPIEREEETTINSKGKEQSKATQEVKSKPTEKEQVKREAATVTTSLAEKQGFLAEAPIESLKGLESALGYGGGGGKGEWRSNDMLSVDLKLSNELQGKFLIDLAAGHSMLSKEAENALGELCRRGDSSADNQAHMVHIDQVELAGYPLGSWSPVVFEEEVLPLQRPGMLGVLGMDFLSRFDVDLDFANKRISIFNPGMLLRHNPTLPGAQQTDVPISIGPRGVIETEIVLYRDDQESERIPAIIDTGLAYTMVNWPAANLVGVDKQGGGGARQTSVVIDSMGSQPVPAFEAPVGVKFPGSSGQPVRLSQRVICVGDDSFFAEMAPTGSPLVLLGMDILADIPWANRLSLSLEFNRMRICAP